MANVWAEKWPPLPSVARLFCVVLGQRCMYVEEARVNPSPGLSWVAATERYYALNNRRVRGNTRIPSLDRALATEPKRLQLPIARNGLTPFNAGAK